MHLVKPVTNNDPAPTAPSTAIGSDRDVVVVEEDHVTDHHKQTDIIDLEHWTRRRRARAPGGAPSPSPSAAQNQFTRAALGSTPINAADPATLALHDDTGDNEKDIIDLTVSARHSSSSHVHTMVTKKKQKNSGRNKASLTEIARQTSVCVAIFLEPTLLMLSNRPSTRSSRAT